MSIYTNTTLMQQFCRKNKANLEGIIIFLEQAEAKGDTLFFNSSDSVAQWEN